MISDDPPHQVRYSRMRARCATSSTSAGPRAIFRAHVATLRAQPRLGRSSCGAKCCACATRAATRRWPPSCWRSNWAASRSGSSWGLSRQSSSEGDIPRETFSNRNNYIERSSYNGALLDAFHPFDGLYILHFHSPHRRGSTVLSAKRLHWKHALAFK